MGVDILIVEDDADIAEAIARMLEKRISEARITLASDGAEALAILQCQRFDLIVSDWNMPHRGGDELLVDVRSQPGSAAIPFLMLTARSDRDSVVTAVQAGVTDYLAKPFAQDALVRKVQQLLSRPHKAGA